MNFILLFIGMLILGGDIAFFFLYLIKKPNVLFLSDHDVIRKNLLDNDNTLTKHDIKNKINKKLMTKRILAGVSGGSLAISLYLIFKSLKSVN